MITGLPSRRAGALALAAAVLAGATVGASGAAAAAPPPFFSGTTTADGVRLVVTFPQDVQGFGNSLDLGLLSANGSLVSNALPGQEAPPTATSTASLASGTLVDPGQPLAPLNQSVTATLANPSASSSLGAFPDNPLGLALSAGNLRATSTPTPLGTGSYAQLADFRLGALDQILPPELLDPVTSNLQTLVAGLQPVLTSLNGAIAQVNRGCPSASPSPSPSSSASPSPSASPNPLSPVTSPVAGGIDEVGAAVGMVTGPVVAGICAQSPQEIKDTLNALTALNKQVQALIDSLPALLASITNGSLVSLSGVVASQGVQQDGEGVRATATSKLAKLSLLGGFITVDGFENAASAYVTGQPGAATATPQPGLAEVKVGDNLFGLTIGDKGITLPQGTPLDALGPALQPVNDGLQMLVDELNAILNQAGLSVRQAAGSQDIGADGKTASARASSLMITYTIPSTTTPLVQLAVGNAQAAVAAADTAVEATTVTNPGTLARTGAELPLAAGVGLALLVAAGLLLRRRATAL